MTNLITKKKLRVKTRPFSSAHMIRSFPPNTQVTRINRVKRWSHVRIIDTITGKFFEGWVRSSALRNATEQESEHYDQKLAYLIDKLAA